jgi:hypothetical protein
MSVHTDIRAAARQTILATNGLPSAKFWEGERFSTTLGQPYLAEQVSAIGSVVRATGTGGTIAHTIAVRATLGYPAGKGTVDIETAAAALMAKFRPGSWLAYGGQTGLVQQCERSSLRQDPDWIACTVTATVVAYTIN